MKKEGQSTALIWIGIGGFILFIIAVVTLLIIISQGGSGEVEEVQPPINLYLKAVNYLNESESVDANYRIEYNGTLIKEGLLSKDSMTEIEVPRKQLSLICWADGYYLGRTYKMFSGEELRLNASKALCNMKKIGNISVKHTGEIKEGDNLIRLNISANGIYGKMKICNRWSTGIISALPVNSELICDKGVWLNWSKRDPKTKELTMLPETYFRCGECSYPYCDWTARCSSVEGRNCKEYTTKIPSRYIGKVDNCYYPGKSLNNNWIIVDYLVKASNLNPLDEIEFFIMDSDRRHDQTENMLMYMTEQNGKNLAAEDTKYLISYYN